MHANEMKTNSIIRKIGDRLLNLIPLSKELRNQLKSKIDTTLKSAFDEFGLLTQADLEQQIRALNKAQERIAELEQDLERLESKISQQDKPN